MSKDYEFLKAIMSILSSKMAILSGIKIETLYKIKILLGIKMETLWIIISALNKENYKQHNIPLIFLNLY